MPPGPNFREYRRAAARDLRNAKKSGVAAGISPLVSSDACRVCLAKRGKVFPINTCTVGDLPPYADCEFAGGCESSTTIVLKAAHAGRAKRKPMGCVGRFVVACLLLLLLGLIGSALNGPGPGPGPAPRAPAQDSTPAPAPAASHSPGVGDLAVLHIPGNSYLYLAASDAAWNEMLDAENKRDAGWMGELVAAGKVLKVTNGTAARVLKLSFASRMVRIAEGPNAGSEGWIQLEFVKDPAAVK